MDLILNAEEGGQLFVPPSPGGELENWLVLLVLAIPLAGALLIGLSGRVNDNLRESMTLLTAITLIACVWSLLPEIFAGERPGHNFRLSELQAALGASQLTRLADRVAARARLARAYDERLAGLAGLRLPAPVGTGHASAQGIRGAAGRHPGQALRDRPGCVRSQDQR